MKSSIAEKWELDCAVLGETFESDVYFILFNGEEVASFPPSLICDGCPQIHWPSRIPEDLEKRRELELDDLPLPDDWNEALEGLLTLPSLAPKQWIYDQYDSMVQVNTVKGPGNPVSVLRIKGRESLIAMVFDADPWKCYLDPFRGGAETVARTARALAVAGAEPLGLTDCLNFPSPEVPEQYWVLEECVKGMAACCEAIECPVVSGNVSLYNESPEGAILPTPVVGTVGIIPSFREYLPSGDWEEGDVLFMVGPCNTSLAGSRYSARGNASFRPALEFWESRKGFHPAGPQDCTVGAAFKRRALAGGDLAAALAKDSAESGKGAAVYLAYPREKTWSFRKAELGRFIRSHGESSPVQVIWNGYPCNPPGRSGQYLDVEGAFAYSGRAWEKWRIR